MESTVAILLIVVSLAIVAKVAIDVKAGKTELVSLRNFFLMGFVLFQCTSAAIPLYTKQYPRYPLDSPAATALRYAAMVIITLVLFFVVYDRAPIVGRLAQKMPRGGQTPNIWKLMGLGACCLLLAIVFRFTVQIPLWGILANFAGGAMAAVAAGVAGWVWAPRLLNPAVAMVALAIILGAMAVTITGAFGRRGLVSVAACVGWGMYYSHFRHMPKLRYMPYLLGVGTVSVVFLAVFTSIRGEGVSKNFSAMDFVQAMMSGGSLRDGMVQLIGGQETGHVSMWLLEQFPERLEHEDYLTFRYLVMIPIPRSMWAEKPWPISIRIPEIANLRKVPIGSLTIGPGLIGTAWADGGWIAVFLYPMFFALLFRLLDGWMRENADNLFIVLPIGAAVGEIVAIPRGEISLFLFMYLFALVSAWAIMLTFAKLLRFESAAPSAFAGVPTGSSPAQTPHYLPPSPGSSDFDGDSDGGAWPDAEEFPAEFADPVEPHPEMEPSAPAKRLDWAEFEGGDGEHAWGAES